MTEQNEIVLYRPDETLSLEVKLDVERDTVWLNRQQLAVVAKDAPTQLATGAKFATVQTERKSA